MSSDRRLRAGALEAGSQD